MSERSSMFGDSSEQEGSLFGASSASLMSFTHSLSHRPRRQDSSTRTNPFSINPTVYTPQNSSQTSSIASSNSSGSRHKSYTTCDEWVWGVLPRFPISREPGPLFSASSLNDPILRSFASHTPSASPADSAIGQTAGLNTPSSSSTEATESDATDSDEEEPNFGGGDEELGTPDTSDASVSDIIFVFDQVDVDQVGVIPNREVLIGLQLPEELLKTPSFSDTYDDNNIDHIDEFLRNRSTNLRAKVDATPYTAGTEDWWPDYNGATLAPSPGFAYNEYYLPTRKYTKRHKTHRKFKVILASCEAELTSDESITGTTENNQNTTVLGECSGAWIDSGSKGHENWYNNSKNFPKTLQPLNFPHRIHNGYSPKTLASIFHPPFLVSHLSPFAVSTFATGLYAPHGLAYNTEYPIDLSFHFGPPLVLDVCTFTPRDTKSLRSYQKHLDKDSLDVQDSLPIALNLFALEWQAAELDAWLEGIVDSESSLTEYGELMQRRQKGHQSPQILKSVVSWYLASKNELSESADQILRTAMKLLITTTLLNIVPKVIDPPESLLNYLSSQYPQPAINISLNAPKLLTRQIKASVFHLQQDLLHALFSRFNYAKKLPAEVKVAVAILVAFVLDLLRDMSRAFAKYSRLIDSTVDVKEQEIAQYEMNVQTQLFDIVRVSILNAVEKTGRLGERLRDLGSRVKGKEKETQESEFVSAILNNVYKE